MTIPEVVNAATIVGAVLIDTVALRFIAVRCSGKKNDVSSPWSTTWSGSFALALAVLVLTWGAQRIAGHWEKDVGIYDRVLDLGFVRIEAWLLISFGIVLGGVVLASLVLGVAIKRRSGANLGFLRAFPITLGLLILVFVWVVGLGMAVLGPTFH